jgi:nicotinamide mononucleotide transporter
MTTIDIIITFLSILYIYFATQNKSICFVFGLFASTLWAYHDFANLNLKFDGFLQIFYVGMSVWGLIAWKKNHTHQEELQVTRMSWREHTHTFFVSLIVGVGLAWLTRNALTTALPYLDAITTAFAITATFMLIKRKLENWIYWIFIDITYIYIFIRQDAPLLAGIMGLYGLLAIYGFLEWRRSHLKTDV